MGPPTRRTEAVARGGALLRSAPLLSLAVLLSGCDAWQRFVESFAVGVALFFAAILTPLAVGGGVGFVAGRRRPPSGVSTGGAWGLAVMASFFSGLAGQLLEALFDYAPWAVALPLLGIPATAWALDETGRLLRARGQPEAIWWGVGAAGVGYLVWLGTMIVPCFT